MVLLHRALAVPARGQEPILCQCIGAGTGTAQVADCTWRRTVHGDHYVTSLVPEVGSDCSFM